MKVTILTLFPEMFDGVLNQSIIKRAINNNKIEVKLVNIRDFAINKHNQVDDYPFGGGAGMLLMIEPVVKALNSVKTDDSFVILTSAQGKVYDQQLAHNFSKKKDLIIICGHYEGIDSRIEEYIDLEVCIGEYILTGGEIPAMIITDSVTRLISEVISEESLNHESFNDYLLEGPQYTRPVEYDGLRVPDVLISGHHKNIAKFQLDSSIETTKKKRPDLYQRYLNENKKV